MRRSTSETTSYDSVLVVMNVCQCGCEQSVAIGNNFVRGHNRRVQPPTWLDKWQHGHSGNLTHDMSYTPEYHAWQNAKTRCNNPRFPGYKDYGGRGIKFLFDSFEQWFEELGLRPTPDHSVDRINNHGHYEPGNVRWATDQEQHANQRPEKGDPHNKRGFVGRHVRHHVNKNVFSPNCALCTEAP